MFICERCGYSSIYKSNLRNHLNRKNKCNPIIKDIGIVELKAKMNQNHPNESKMNPNESKMNPNESKKYICKFCVQVYSTNSNLHKHMKKCPSIEKYDKNDADKILNYIKILDKERKQLTKKIEELLIKGTVTNNTNNNIMNQQNIIINNYGKENLDYITPDYLTELLKKPFGAIQSLLKTLHFNEEHPENNNIKIPNKKEKYVTVYNSGNWEFKNKKDVIENIVDNGYNMLDSHYVEVGDTLEKVKKDRFSDFQGKYESDGKTKKNIENDAEMIILNGNDIPFNNPGSI